jgi:hypothetical protein
MHGQLRTFPEQINSAHAQKNDRGNGAGRTRRANPVHRFARHARCVGFSHQAVNDHISIANQSTPTLSSAVVDYHEGHEGEELENNTLDAIFQIGVVEVVQQSNLRASTLRWHRR